VRERFSSSWSILASHFGLPSVCLTKSRNVFGYTRAFVACHRRLNGSASFLDLDCEIDLRSIQPFGSFALSLLTRYLSRDNDLPSTPRSLQLAIDPGSIRESLDLWFSSDFRVFRGILRSGRSVQRIQSRSLCRGCRAKGKFRTEAWQLRLFQLLQNRTPMARVSAFEGRNFLDNAQKLGQSEPIQDRTRPL